MEQTAAVRERIVSWEDPAILQQAGMAASGLEVMTALLNGTLPAPPVIQLLGISLAEVEAGRVVMTLPVDEHLYNPMATVHGGMITTLLDSVVGCAVHTILPHGRGYTTLEIKVNFVRGATIKSGTLIGEGRVVHHGRQTAIAEGTIKDANGKLYATASTTCLLFDFAGNAN